MAGATTPASHGGDLSPSGRGHDTRTGDNMGELFDWGIYKMCKEVG